MDGMRDRLSDGDALTQEGELEVTPSYSEFVDGLRLRWFGWELLKFCPLKFLSIGALYFLMFFVLSKK